MGVGNGPKVRPRLFLIYFCEGQVRSMQMSSFYTSPEFHHRNFEKHCLGKRQFHSKAGPRGGGVISKHRGLPWAHEAVSDQP